MRNILLTGSILRKRPGSGAWWLERLLVATAGHAGELREQLAAGGPAQVGFAGQGASDNRLLVPAEHAQVRRRANVARFKGRRRVVKWIASASKYAIADRQSVLIRVGTEAALEDLRGAKVRRTRLVPRVAAGTEPG